MCRCWAAAARGGGWDDQIDDKYDDDDGEKNLMGKLWVAPVRHSRAAVLAAGRSLNTVKNNNENEPAT